MDSLRLRQFWSLIETIQPNALLSMDDHQLVEGLIEQLQERHLLSPHERTTLSCYIRSRVLLIRELAYNKLATDNLSA